MTLTTQSIVSTQKQEPPRYAKVDGYEDLPEKYRKIFKDPSTDVENFWDIFNKIFIEPHLPKYSIFDIFNNPYTPKYGLYELIKHLTPSSSNHGIIAKIEDSEATSNGLIAKSKDNGVGGIMTAMS